MNKKDLTLDIKQLSQDLNFDLVGVASSNFNDRLAKDNFQNWIDSGYSASMHWLANRSTERNRDVVLFIENGFGVDQK